MKRALFAVSMLALAACGAPEVASSQWHARPTGAKNVSSGSPAEAFFPLIDGNVYLYGTQNELGEAGLLMARVHRDDPQHGTLTYSGGSTKRFSYTGEGVQLESRLGTSFILKVPLQEGTTWRGEHGGNVKIIKTNQAVEVPAGSFTGCVQTLEERLGDAPVRYATMFCPTVGVVVLEAATGANLERAELRSYGEPKDLGPEGVTKFKGDPNAPAPVIPPPH